MGNDPIYGHMLRGSFWGVAMRWAVRGVGFVSVILLARLLTPDDFGVMATCALVMGFVTGFSELGIQMLLVRTREIDRAHCDTAWSLKILQGVLIAVVLLLAAPAAADYFNEPRTTTLLRILAFNALLGGFDNIGMVLARRELNFALDFRFNVYQRLVMFVATVGAAVALRNYWALLIGQFVGTAAGVVLSYAMHPYRPRWSLAKLREYLRFGTSIVPINVGKYLNDRVDVLTVGGVGSTTQLGVYNMASEISFMATKELVLPISRGLLPTYAKLTHDLPRLSAAYLRVLGIVAAIIAPIGFGLSAIARDFVVVVFGAKWLEGAAFLEWLSHYALVGALIHMLSGQIMIVTGHERLSAILMWVRLLVLVPCVVLAGQLYGSLAVAQAALLASVIVLPVCVHQLARTLDTGMFRIFAAMIRPLLAAAGMAVLIRMVEDLMPGPVILRLALEVLAGACSYVVLTLLLWLAAGRPEGAERAVGAWLLRRFSPRSKRPAHDLAGGEGE